MPNNISAVHNAVHRAVHRVVRGAVHRAVHSAIHLPWSTSESYLQVLLMSYVILERSVSWDSLLEQTAAGELSYVSRGYAGYVLTDTLKSQDPTIMQG